MLIFLLTFTLTAWADFESINAHEKTYPRDNTFCIVGGKRVEFQLKGESSQTDTHERGMGEYLFYKLDEKKPVLLAFNRTEPDMIKFFPGKNALCSKTQAYMVAPYEMALLLLKDNVPFKPKLMIQLWDTKTTKPLDAVETQYPTDKAYAMAGGFAFRTFAEEINLGMGKAQIEGQEYLYHEKLFPKWLSYKGRSFSPEPEITYKEFPWKSFFKDQTDFQDFAGWDKARSTFKKKIVIIATSQKLKKECILLLESKQKLVGMESWRCRAL